MHKQVIFEMKCLNQWYLIWSVVMRFVHTKGSTWYNVLNKHTMHVVSLSNISINNKFKANNKGRNKINKFEQYCEGDYLLCITSRLFVAVHSIALLMLLTLTCFTPYSNEMTSWHNSSAEKTRATSSNYVITTVWW